MRFQWDPNSKLTILQALKILIEEDKELYCGGGYFPKPKCETPISIDGGFLLFSVLGNTFREEEKA